MRNINRTAGSFITGCVIAIAFCSCNGDGTTTDNTKSVDSFNMAMNKAAMDTVMASPVTDSMPEAEANNNNNASKSKESNKSKKLGDGTAHNVRFPDPDLGGHLKVTSTAFGKNGVIPAKYTCEGQGATPPINIGNIPAGTKSFALIVHDYNASNSGGQTYWLIWNLDSTGNIPENYINNTSAMNAANQYGYNPICAKYGDHRYHFMVYALDCKLVIGKHTTKPVLERVMKDHILDKGELVGVYNKKIQ